MNNIDENIKKIIEKYGEDILLHENMQRQKEFIQHGNISCYEHSLTVAYISVMIALKYNIAVDMKSLVRGALLHDYFLYDWHIKNENKKWHGFRHARTAYENAKKDYNLTDIEKDIILKHMFPVNIKLPKYRESVIVTIADKICATSETLSLPTILKRINEFKLIFVSN